MKKFIVFIAIFVLCVFIFPFFIKGNYKYTELDCVENGICKEGIEYYIGKEKFTITKESCLKLEKKWLEEKKLCIMR